MTDVVIFGTGSFAELVDVYLTSDDRYDVVAFSVSDDLFDEESPTLRDRPIVKFSDLDQHFDRAVTKVFVAIGYRGMNAIRREFCLDLQKKGFSLLTYVHPSVIQHESHTIGKNVFIFEDNTVQPFVKLGDGVVLWSGNHIGHHSVIDDWVFVASHVVISGHCSIGESSFLGVNCTIADGVCIASSNLIGPGAVLQKNTQPGEVWLADKAKKFPKPSSFFLN